MASSALCWPRSAANNRFYLCKLGITHVLNAAEGKKNNGTVDTCQVGCCVASHLNRSIKTKFCQKTLLIYMYFRREEEVRIY